MFLGEYLSRDLIHHLVIFQAAILLIAGVNIILIRKTRRYQLPGSPPSVSILVPARNEEANIGACVASLLEQDHPDFEVIVLDDGSTDQTRQILEDLSRSQPTLTVLEGKPGLTGHPGKNWACSQLAEAARGELLFFTDADTIHDPETTSKVVAALEGTKADLVTGYPRQLLGTWGERLLVPFFSWAVLVFFPLGLAYRLKTPLFTTAVGQLMVFRRKAYQTIGGHSGVSASIVDDLALARKIHQAGLRWRIIQITDLISCRMYRTGREALNGFSKNLFAAFEFRLIPFIFAFTWLGVVYLLPLILLLLHLAGWAPLAQPDHLLVCVILSFLTWLLPYLHLGIPGWLAALYPLTVLANLFSAVRSLWRSTRGELTWKDRTIQPDSWKWL